MKDPNLTAPDLVESDFSAAGLQCARIDEGQMLSLPWSVDYSILYYNKEMLPEEGGRRYPKTLGRDGSRRRRSPTDPQAGTFGFVGARPAQRRT